MDALRVVLIDPCDETREDLQRQLRGLDSVWLAEVCKSYAGAVKAVAEQSPELAVINLDSDPEAALQVINTVARQHPRSAMLPASREHSTELILRTVRAGAREFLTLPAGPPELLAAIGNLVQAPAGGTATRLTGRVTVLTGAAGGTGCTSLAVNLATWVARDERRSVALADFDLCTGAVDACLDVVPNYTLLEVVQNAERLDLTLLKRSMARHASGLYVLPRPTAVEDAARVDLDSTHRVVTLLKAAFSTVVIDASKALHASDFVAFELADTVLLVAQLDLACLRNTARLAQTLRQVDGLGDKLKLVINRAGFRDCQIQPKKAEELLKMPVAWTIPDAPHEFTLSRSKGAPLSVEFGRSRACKAIEEMAKALAGDEAEGKLRAPTPTTASPRRIAAMF